MSWVKKGKILEINNNAEWMSSHSSLPIFFPVDKDTFRIYFSTRNKEGRSYPAYAVYDRHTWELKKISANPILEWGRAGSFDDSGIMCSSIVKYKDIVYMYYIGWNQCILVPYHLSIGLAISDDNGETFRKFSDGPIMDRSLYEPIFNTSPVVLFESNKWEMWYTSCTHWIQGEVKKEPVYNIRYAQSEDGINWVRYVDKPCIEAISSGEAIGRPWVFKENGLYKMWYSYRKTLDYRNNRNNSYKIGYAESEDGCSWLRKDSEAGIGLSDSGWDSDMICYNSVFEEGNKKYMLYNGNTFGKTGVGLAVWEDENPN